MFIWHNLLEQAMLRGVRMSLSLSCMIQSLAYYIITFSTYIILHFLFYKVYFSDHPQSEKRYHALKVVEFFVVVLTAGPIGGLVDAMPEGWQVWYTYVLLWLPLLISKLFFIRKYKKLL